MIKISINDPESLQVVGTIHNIEDAVKKACKQPTLLDALTYMAIWESGRIVEQAKDNLAMANLGMKSWDSCFNYCFKKVFEEYPMAIVREVMNS
jgi:hypothetical protein